MRLILRDYQQNGLQFCRNTQHPYLDWEMRLGKTIVAIRTILSQRGNCKMLVVGPFSAIGSWYDELTREQSPFKVIRGSRDTRLSVLSEIQKYSSGPMWALINKEGHTVVPEMAGMEWDAVIWDEAVFLASPENKCQTTRYFLNHFRTVKHRWGLCGTPAPETPLQWFSQLKWLDAANFKERSYYEFRHKYFAKSMFDYTITDEGKKYLTSTLCTSVSSLRRSNVAIQYTSKLKITRFVELPNHLVNVYDKIVDEFVLSIDAGNPVDTVWATQQYIWMRMICGGFSKKYGILSHHKCNVLLDILNRELHGEQCVVWCDYVDEVLGVCDYLSHNNKRCVCVYGEISDEKRAQCIRYFQEGKSTYLIAVTGCLSFATKLTAAKALIYYSAPVSKKVREQSEDRHVAVGCNDEKLIIDIPCYGTIDEDIIKSYDDKEYASGAIGWLLRTIQKKEQI
jgi:hypothetical protein